MSKEEPPKPWKGCLAAILLICSGPVLVVAYAFLTLQGNGLDHRKQDLADVLGKMGITLPLVGVVIGVLCLWDMLKRRKMGYKPPVAPPPLPQPQSEECSKQEEEKIQPENED